MSDTITAPITISTQTVSAPLSIVAGPAGPTGPAGEGLGDHEATYAHEDIAPAAAHAEDASGASHTGKENTQTAASQVEAEAGTEAAIRSWSPLRVWQAIAKWGITATSLFSGILKNYKETRYAATTTGNVTIDLANGNVQRFILDAARQFTLPADPGDYGQSFVLIIECATFTPTWNTSPALEWLTSDGAAPTLVTTANLVNVLTFIWDDTDSRWLGFLAGKETA